jgi:hypothetical protein
MRPGETRAKLRWHTSSLITIRGEGWHECARNACSITLKDLTPLPTKGMTAVTDFFPTPPAGVFLEARRGEDMAPKPEPPLIGAVEDKKAVGGRHKQPGRLAFVSWATIRRIYDIARAALWALVVATVVNMIINIPQISEARRRAELQRVQEISEDNRFYCTKWGLRANTHEHLICMMDLDAIRAKVEQRISEDWMF